MKWIKRIIAFVSISVAIYVLVIVLYFLSPSISDFFNRTDFNSNEWIEWEDTEFTQKLRWNMIHDLTNNHNLIGKSASQIKDLLGEPDYEGKTEMSYYLGLTGFGINTGSLTLKFRNGVVVDFNVHQG